MPNADRGSVPGEPRGPAAQLVECHLKATLNVASLGLFTEILSKTSPILGLGNPIDSTLSSKEGPMCLFFLMCYLEQIILHSYMVAVFFVLQKSNTCLLWKI